MIVKRIVLRNFRNHSSYVLECKDETSLILGNNGCGKTSVLEAFYIAMRGKSFRAVDNEILKRGKEFYRVELEYVNGEVVVVTYDGVVKQFVIMDKKTRRLPRKSKYPVVLFLPSDLNMVSSSPSRRRDYFDRVFTQLDEKYAEAINKYEKALRQRNELLKTETVDASSIFSWNILLARYGVEIFGKRSEMVNMINQKITKVYRSIAKNDDKVELGLETQVGDVDEGNYLRRLEDEFERDKFVGHTGFGVHRDDFVFYFNNEEAEGSASRGEVRSIILALKFIEAEMIESQTGKKPVVLLDDVFSELDEVRRKCLVDNFKNNQVIITSVEG